MTPAPAHQRAAHAWLARAGIAWTRERYARPQAGGETGAYRLRPAGTPRARIVAAHGAGNDALFPLLTLSAALVARGFEVFAWDGDGQGRDTTTRFHPRAVRSSVAAAVAASAAGEPALPTHLLGHSLGGSLVAGALADGSVADVRSASLLAAPTSIRVGLRVSLAEVGGFFHPATLGEMRRFGRWGVVPAAGRLKRAAFPVRLMEARPGAFGYVDAIMELLRELDLERAAEGITVPVQLVYGGRDALVPAAQGERLAESMPAG
ncbi:MAG TPA: alpha/beta fold hydrolase, partial [Longimicrobiaceae bacterium]|nr:alpha/beta fold hydrolase [Longimicrobiaceae bacterium]